MKKTALLLMAIMVASLTFAQTDLSGTWKINAEKSKVGERSFGAGTLIITQKDNNLTIESHTSFQDQEMTTTDKLTMDGKECVNTGMMDIQKKSIATWSEDKSTLKVTTTINFQDQDMKQTETYKLVAGNLVVEFSMNAGPMGDMKETRVYDKK